MNTLRPDQINWGTLQSYCKERRLAYVEELISANDPIVSARIKGKIDVLDEILNTEKSHKADLAIANLGP